MDPASGDWNFSGLPSQEPARPSGAPVAPPSPRQAGEYLLIEPLGQGGMGSIWRGRHRTLGREVAVKLLLEGARANPRQRERFMNEARAAARLAHPQIVAIHDVGETGGVPYLVMDLVAGESVGARLKRAGPFAPETAVRVTLQVARALEHAHSRNVLHRDVKPNNILLDAQGAPSLVDFGLAKLLDTSREALTRTGDVLGTPGYMAPEQARGEADERTDVYSLGATLFAMLSGGPPLTARTLMEFIARLQHSDAPPLRKVRPEADPGLARIVDGCLRRAPAQRYRSAGALAEDLQRWLDGEQTLGPASEAELARPPRRWRLLPGLLAAGVLLLAAGGAWRWRDPAASAARALEEAQAHLRAQDRSAALAALDRGLEADPGSRRLRAERARLRQEREDFAGALEDVQVALNGGDDDARLVLLRGQLERALGRQQDAARSCARALELDPGLGEAWLFQARLHVVAGDTASALAEADRAVALNTPGALRDRALLRERLGQRAQAVMDLETLLAAEPHDRDAWKLLANLRGKLGDLPGTIEAITRCLELDPGDPLSWLARSQVRMQMRDLERAAVDCDRALELSPDSLAALEQRALIHSGAGDLRGAREVYDRMLELAPQRASAWGNRGTLRLELGDPEGAEADFLRAQELEPENPHFPVCRSALLERKRDFPGMCALLDPVLARHPHHLEGLFARASARGNLGQWEGARADLDHLLELAPRHARALVMRAQLELQGEGHERAALADLDRALAVNAHDLDALVLRGVVRARLGAREGAMKDLREFLRLAPADHWRIPAARSSLRYLEEAE